MLLQNSLKVQFGTGDIAKVLFQFKQKMPPCSNWSIMLVSENGQNLLWQFHNEVN